MNDKGSSFNKGSLKNRLRTIATRLLNEYVIATSHPQQGHVTPAPTARAGEWVGVTNSNTFYGADNRALDRSQARHRGRSYKFASASYS